MVCIKGLIRRSKMGVVLSLLTSFLVQAEDESPAPVRVYATEAELFGMKVNDLSQQELEMNLSRMGLESYPTYRKDYVSYGLGPEGILGIRDLSVHYNSYRFVEKMSLSGVIESNQNRKALGKLLLDKYGKPTAGFVTNGYGRAQWLFDDGTLIELHNTTFDVSLLYVDREPMVQPLSGRIDVEALKNQTQKR